MPYYSDIELTVRKSKTFERVLRQDFGAQGESFGQLINSVQGQLPDEAVQQLYEVSDLRNDIVHEEYINNLADRKEFLNLCNNTERTLNKIAKSRSAKEKFLWLLFITFVTAISILYILFESST